MCGEWQFAGRLVEIFANYHRASYGGCKSGMGDVLIGAAALMVEFNGTEKASHIRDKLQEMVHLNFLLKTGCDASA
jgi:4-hydroxybutyryl-CoA dehydratase/vinylacetyl-CoA-Delta-isomerase